ncbi:MAG: type II toxin-antitoxin system RelE/ParE family toxin [Chitinophagaceae bacterium]|nr:type II toxin-antitoxin system RelE/ParE family toxin [Chitinophagaceae bacterium]
MALKIEWTANAIEDYKQVVDYLLKEWPLKVAADFVNNLEERVDNLNSFPNIGMASLKDPSIRSIVITKHNKLYYRNSPGKIEILGIFDTRQSPGKNKYD